MTVSNNNIVRKYLKERDVEFHSAKKYLLLLSLENNPKLVGSYSNKGFSYYNDLDLMQTINLNDFEKQDDAVTNLASVLVSLGNRINLHPDIYFSELKIGFDPVFQKLYELSGDEKQSKSCDKIKAKTELNNLYNNKYININEKNELNNILLKSNVQFNEIVRRDFYTLRWNLKELLKQEKNTKDGKISLKTTIKQNTMIKLDVICLIKLCFREITAIYTVYYTKNQAKYYLSSKLDNNYFPCGSSQQVLQMFTENKKIKACKRLLLLSKYLYQQTKDKKAEKMIVKLDKIVNSDVVGIERVYNEVIVLQRLLKITRKVPYREVLVQLLGFYNRVIDHLRKLENNPEKYRLLRKNVYPSLLDSANKIVEFIDVKQNGSYQIKGSLSSFQKKFEKILDDILDLLEPIIKDYSNKIIDKVINVKEIKEYFKMLKCKK